MFTWRSKTTGNLIPALIWRYALHCHSSNSIRKKDLLKFSTSTVWGEWGGGFGVGGGLGRIRPGRATIAEYSLSMAPTGKENKPWQYSNYTHTQKSKPFHSLFPKRGNQNDRKAPSTNTVLLLKVKPRFLLDFVYISKIYFAFYYLKYILCGKQALKTSCTAWRITKGNSEIMVPASETTY